MTLHNIDCLFVYMQCLWIAALGKTAHNRKKPFFLYWKKQTHKLYTEMQNTQKNWILISELNKALVNKTEYRWKFLSLICVECVSLFIFVFLCASCLTGHKFRISSQKHCLWYKNVGIGAHLVETNVESSYTSIMTCTLKFWLFELTNWSLKSNYCLTCIW